MFSCSKKKDVEQLSPEELRLQYACAAFKGMKHPQAFSDEINAILAKIEENPAAFIEEIQAVIAADENDLLTLIDKKHFVSSSFEPADLMALKKNDVYPIGRTDLSLRVCAEAALREMALAAKTEQINLLVSSTYRSYAYQEKLFQRWVDIDGLEEAERESARAGTSQHQLGTAIDFGSIEDDYAETKAGKWLAANAAAFGYTLSFPKGYEPVTGYKWECWHFRYIGKPAAEFQKNWFNDIQQYMLEFVYCWKNAVIPEAVLEAQAAAAAENATAEPAAE